MAIAVTEFPTFTDERFPQHRRGLAPLTSSGQAGALDDLGRFVVTGNDADRGAFKTPTLREVARTAPYMHDGSFATLDAVVEFYDGGGRPNPHIDPEIHPLHLMAGEK